MLFDNSVSEIKCFVVVHLVVVVNEPVNKSSGPAFFFCCSAAAFDWSAAVARGAVGFVCPAGHTHAHTHTHTHTHTQTEKTFLFFCLFFLTEFCVASEKVTEKKWRPFLFTNRRPVASHFGVFGLILCVCVRLG